MSGPATLAQSAAILKTKYPTGELPKEQYKKFNWVGTVDKTEDWGGDDRVVALQTENPQGSSADFGTALGSLQQGAYYRFSITRVEHYGLARIRDHALKAAAGNENALANLWDNETNGAEQTELESLEIYGFGTGTGVLGQIASGSTTATITLTNVEDVAKFRLGMRVQAISANSLTATVRTGGFASISGIDRKGGTLTVTTAWNTQITDLGTTDYLVRAGDAPNTITASGPSVIWGMGSYIVGGSSPGTLGGLNRNPDPVRLAGQAFDATNANMAEAIIDCESLLVNQGRRSPKTLWAHPRDIAHMRKTADAKSIFTRKDMDSTIAGISYRALEIEGDDGNITIMTNPFISRYQAFLGDMDAFTLESLGPAPQLIDFDSNSFLRVANDAAEEVRFGYFANLTCKSPVDWINISNFGK